MAKNRNIGLCIVFSIITCGIYGIYWFIVLTNEINSLARREDDTTGGVAFLLSLITCGIYGLYWAYKMGEKVDIIHQEQNQPSSNSGILYLILNFIGLGIIVYALLQNEINKIVPPEDA